MRGDARADGLLALQRRAGNAAVQSALASPGTRLPAQRRAAFEAHLGADLADVRVHEDAASTEALRASAYTVGDDVVVHPGHYEEGTPAGDLTMAHELAHVVQQRRGAVDGRPTGDGLKVSDPDDRFEREADRSALAFGRRAGMGPLPDDAMAVSRSASQVASSGGAGAGDGVAVQRKGFGWLKKLFGGKKSKSKSKTQKQTQVEVEEEAPEQQTEAEPEQEKKPKKPRPGAKRSKPKEKDQQRIDESHARLRKHTGGDRYEQLGAMGLTKDDEGRWVDWNGGVVDDHVVEAFFDVGGLSAMLDQDLYFERGEWRRPIQGYLRDELGYLESGWGAKEDYEERGIDRTKLGSGGVLRDEMVGGFDDLVRVLGRDQRFAKMGLRFEQNTLVDSEGTVAPTGYKVRHDKREGRTGVVDTEDLDFDALHAAGVEVLPRGGYRYDGRKIDTFAEVVILVGEHRERLDEAEPLLDELGLTRSGDTVLDWLGRGVPGDDLAHAVETAEALKGDGTLASLGFTFDRGWRLGEEELDDVPSLLDAWRRRAAEARAEREQAEVDEEEQRKRDEEEELARFEQGCESLHLKVDKVGNVLDWFGRPLRQNEIRWVHEILAAGGAPHLDELGFSFEGGRWTVGGEIMTGISRVRERMSFIEDGLRAKRKKQQPTQVLSRTDPEDDFTFELDPGVAASLGLTQRGGGYVDWSGQPVHFDVVRRLVGVGGAEALLDKDFERSDDGGWSRDGDPIATLKALLTAMELAITGKQNYGVIV